MISLDSESKWQTISESGLAFVHEILLRLLKGYGLDYFTIWGCHPHDDKFGFSITSTGPVDESPQVITQNGQQSLDDLFYERAGLYELLKDKNLNQGGDPGSSFTSLFNKIISNLEQRPEASPDGFLKVEGSQVALSLRPSALDFFERFIVEVEKQSKQVIEGSFGLILNNALGDESQPMLFSFKATWI